MSPPGGIFVGSVVLHLTDRAWVNVLHGAVFGGLFLVTIIVALLLVLLARSNELTDQGSAASARWLARVCGAMVIAGWVAVLTGTFVVDRWFVSPAPHAAASVLRDSATYAVWGSLLLRVKEVVSWAAAVLATAAAYLAYRHRFAFAADAPPRRPVAGLLVGSLAAASLGGALGVLLTKLAPLM